MKNFLFVIAMVSLALAGGCATGGSGTPPATVDVAITSPSNINPAAIYPTQPLTLTATVSGSNKTAVNWSLTGPGTLTPVTPATTPATATYSAPTAAGSATITATVVGDASVKGSLDLTVVDITTNVAPATASVGTGLTQQFTAVNVPDDAPQSFAWTCTATASPSGSHQFAGTPKPYASGACQNFVSDSSGIATYTADAADGCCVTISAVSPLDPSFCLASTKNCTSSTLSLAASRLNGTYAFRFSGFDSSNQAVAVTGRFIATNGAISSGVEDELTSSGYTQHSITGGSYAPSSADVNNSNNAGTLTLTLPTNIYPNSFQAVLDGNGDFGIIESDGHGKGSGLAQKVAANNLFAGSQSYAFGFSGVDFAGMRLGYVGVLSMNGTGSITAGQIDVNDNGASSNSICPAPPCSVTGSYTADGSISGLWHMTITPAGGSAMQFDFFIASGQKSKTNPLTFFAITSPADTSHPAVSGTMVLQDSTQTYNNAAFNGASVSALTGVGGSGANVSLSLGVTDGKGNFSGQFDQNNAGTILSAIQFPGAGSSYTYASSGNGGRYTFQMLGNPSANPVVAPLPFVLYASGQNHGFLLDQSSSSVMTGTMNPQGKGVGAFAASELIGTFAAATTSSADSSVTPVAANLLLTSPGSGVFNVSETTHPSGTPQTVAGTYTLSSSGTGTIVLSTSPTQNFVIYVLDNNGACTGQGLLCEIQDFYMMNADSTTPNASIMFAKQ